MGHLLGSSMVGLMATSSKRAYATRYVTQVCWTQTPCPFGRPLLTQNSTEDIQRQVWFRLCGVSRYWFAQGFVWAYWESLVCMEFYLKTWFCPSYNLSGASPLPLDMRYLILVGSNIFLGFPCGSSDKESNCNAGDMNLIPELGRSPGEGKGCPIQYSGLEYCTGCLVHGVSKSRKWLSHFHFHFQHSPVDGCSAANCSFGVLAEEDEHMSSYSTILLHLF